MKLPINDKKLLTRTIFFEIFKCGRYLKETIIYAT